MNAANVARRARHRVKAWLGRDVYFAPELRAEAAHLGRGLGAWRVATGGLGRASRVYSFGLGDDVSWELDMVARFGCEVHGFDPTPRCLAWLAGPALPEGFVVRRYALGDRDGTVTLFPPADPAHVFFSAYKGAEAGVEVPVRRLGTIMAELGHERIDLLKLDIEGAEYDAIDDILADRIEVAQLLVEFHHRWPTVGLEAHRGRAR
jgi:FkbM family methyltransferase